MTKTNYHIPLFPDGIYHLCNRANGSEKLFYSADNYRFLLHKYVQHLGAISDLYAWCLLPNHFHLLVQIKPEAIIASHFQQVKKTGSTLLEDGYADFITERFSNWQNSYAKASNKVYGRKGSLFMNYLRRTQVISDQQLAATIFYIHRNPVHHGYCAQLTEWHWSSYHAYCNREYGFVTPAFVQRFFGTSNRFVQFHNQPVYLKSAQVVE